MNEEKVNHSLNTPETEAYLDNFYEQNLASFVKLQDQRIQITKYISDLAKLKLRIDKDPLSVASQCLSLESNAPTSIENIVKIPTSLFCSDFNLQNYNTRKVTVKLWNKSQSKPPLSQSKTASTVNKIRGRVVDETKPLSFNKLWSEEEQLLFEHLLDVIPFEKSELARCRKIADAMGTRTPRQVRSRLQKYYKKLKVFDKYQQQSVVQKFGSIPSTFNKNVAMISNRVTAKVFRKSTFLPRYNVKEHFSNVDVDSSRSSEISVKQEEMDPEIKSEILTQLEAFRLQDSEGVSVEHLGYKCVACEEEPITGPRWHCVLCLQRTDLCCACMSEYVKTPQAFASEQHQVSHPFEVIVTPSLGTFNDPDYLIDKFNSNNYLDPNFLPE